MACAPGLSTSFEHPVIDDQLRPAREDHALRVEVPEQIGAMFLGHYRSLRQYGSPARVVNTTEVDFSRNALPVERSSRHFGEFRTKDHFVIVSLLAANDLPGKSMRIAMKKNPSNSCLAMRSSTSSIRKPSAVSIDAFDRNSVSVAFSL